ncbi:MAG TPA: hypothetical protein EYP40_10675 [Chromatiales bacterium]|nr:hypothetical protein [Chromatiales bacterium]
MIQIFLVTEMVQNLLQILAVGTEIAVGRKTDFLMRQSDPEPLPRIRHAVFAGGQGVEILHLGLCEPAPVGYWIAGPALQLRKTVEMPVKVRYQCLDMGRQLVVQRSQDLPVFLAKGK